MAKKKRDETEAEAGPDPTEEELAACSLMVELMRSGRIITYIADILVERVDEIDFPGEPEEAVVMRRFCELVVPRLSADEPAATLWKAARLIESIRDQVVSDFQLEVHGKQRLNQPSS